MTGAGKSVIVADLLAQIGHRFGFRLIVQEGLSHAVLTQTQGCEPIIVNPNGYFALRNAAAHSEGRSEPRIRHGSQPCYWQDRYKRTNTSDTAHAVALMLVLSDYPSEDEVSRALSLRFYLALSPSCSAIICRSRYCVLRADLT